MPTLRGMSSHSITFHSPFVVPFQNDEDCVRIIDKDNQTISWQWNIGRCWISYTLDEQKILENSHSSGCHSVNLSTSSHHYRIDFVKMVQIDSETSRGQDIRRVVLSSSEGFNFTFWIFHFSKISILIEFAFCHSPPPPAHLL
jgi:hypothetical protein